MDNLSSKLLMNLFLFSTFSRNCLSYSFNFLISLFFSYSIYFNFYSMFFYLLSNFYSILLDGLYFMFSNFCMSVLLSYSYAFNYLFISINLSLFYDISKNLYFQVSLSSIYPNNYVSLSCKFIYKFLIRYCNYDTTEGHP